MSEYQVYPPHQPTPGQWRSRIVGHGEEAPEGLLSNPGNWRIHPKPQQDALAGVLDQVGWVQDVIVNQHSGHVVDGHLRVSLAISRREPSIPVVYVDLDEAEERLILATIDPLSAMAATDAEQLSVLLSEISTGDAALQAMLDGLAQSAGLVPPVDEQPGGVDQIDVQHLIIVQCRDERHQAELLARFDEDGIECRALIS